MPRCRASSAAYQSDDVTFDVEDGVGRVKFHHDCYANSVLTGLPAHLVVGAQCFGSSDDVYSGDVSQALMSLHCLRITECSQFKLVVLIHRVVHGKAPDYLWAFTLLSNVPSRTHCVLRHFIIYSSRQFVARLLVQRCFRCPGAALWNSLPPYITSIDSLQSCVVVSKRICSFTRRRRSITVFILYRGLEALGCVNLIWNYHYYYY